MKTYNYCSYGNNKLYDVYYDAEKKKYVNRKDIVKCQFCKNEILKQNKIKKNTTENTCSICYNKIVVIQRWWKDKYWNPKSWICQRRLDKQYRLYSFNSNYFC